jgi:exopolysaccharide biosynthesis polyprenyl glycosylphosphotransferase
VRLAQELGIVVRLFPDQVSSTLLSRLHVERFEGDYVITLFREQMLMQLLGKRLMDITLSLLALVLLSPFLLAIALIIKLTSPGPILFAQERVGMNKRRFKLYKFRSMYQDAEKRRRELEHLNEMDGPVFKIKNDPRVTPIGRFIRKTSIDELPQLVNVLTGHMSLVGPRPPLLAEVDRYEWLYRRRLSIKPGITCFWQISGRNEISFKQWMDLDKQYIDNWSLWLDVKILAQTIPAVLFRKGAS